MSSYERVAQLEQELEVTRENVQKMKEIVVGNEAQHQGLEKQMLDQGEHLESIRDALRKNYTSLHQLEEELSTKLTIPPHGDETTLVSSLYDLVKEMEKIPGKHAAKVAKDTCTGLHTGTCHVLACVRLTHPEINLKEVLTPRQHARGRDVRGHRALGDRSPFL